ncbi:MAG: hypothetical protein ABIG44_06550 [Planctomycetota bacterium]
MVRNIILLVSTLAILGLLFAGYVILVDDPVIDPNDERSGDDSLPTLESGTGQALKVGDALEVPPGEGVEFTVYDERTGLPTERFECDEWTPIRDAKNEVLVTLPRLTTWLPSGMSLVISADEGQIAVDRVERIQGRPKMGELRGNVRLVFDRGTGHDLPPLGQRPQDKIEITLQQLRFDLELGELHTDGPIDILSTDFEVAGVGLDLVWNQADNVVESLVLREGQRLVLYGANSLFRGEIPAVENSQSPTTMPITMPVSRPPRQETRRRSTAYHCVLAGEIVAEQYAGEQRLGQLNASEVELLFDVGGAADRMVGRMTTSAPSSQPDLTERERLEVRWSGPLRLEPAPQAATDLPPRRHFTARGKPIIMSHSDGEIQCGSVEYRDETEQIWLHPGLDGQVHFAMGRGLTAAADSIYIDRKRDLVKLIGDVDLLTQRGEGLQTRQRSITCTLWAELKIAAEPTPTTTATSQPGNELAGYSRLESATFVGDAVVDLGDQRLAAQRIDATFKPASEEESFEAALDTAMALGDVRLGRDDEALECEQLELTFGVTAEGELYPSHMEASGAALISRERSWIRGDHIRADMRPRPPDTEAGGPAFVMQTLDIVGHAELRDPRNKVAARGDHIAARFQDLNELTSASVYGSDKEFGLVHASPYTVGGRRIDLEWQAQTLHVDGPSRLKFKSRRSLQGHRRQRPTPVQVTCDESLHIDGLRNTVHFRGNVTAASGSEKLISNDLTLLLEDVQDEPEGEAERLKPGELLKAARELFNAQQPSVAQQRDLLELLPGEVGNMHKEPVRLVAENALVQSESYTPGDPRPVIHSSIDAPKLEVDIVGREIVTAGQTTLLFTSRQLFDHDPAEKQILGIPSALVTRGPSQTALRCYESMTYVLGEEGPDRRDTVVFKGGVEFIRCTGLEMANFDEMLPQAHTNPELISNLDSRNTALTCDRLECGFEVGSATGSTEPPAASGSGTLRFTWLIASGSTYLRDVHGPVIREVNAHQVDFIRSQNLIRVLSTPQYDARIYEENSQTQDSRILVGKEFTIYLDSNTVRAGATHGEFRDR